MDLWRAYEFLAITIRDYMIHHNQCLYNAWVIKISKQPTAYLLQVRDSLICMADDINLELNRRS